LISVLIMPTKHPSTVVLGRRTGKPRGDEPRAELCRQRLTMIDKWIWPSTRPCFAFEVKA